ncbi:CPP1-like family protein [Phormidesmis sp. 146-12]
MSDRNPYEKLGVQEGATFEEIQSAKKRLLTEFADDQKKLTEIETAYDAVLMERLKMRQEGKIPVPDRIRFPEKLAQSKPSPAPSPSKSSPQWLSNLLDVPAAKEIALPAVIQLALGGVVFFYPQDSTLQLAMAVSVASTLYFIYRKERKLGRSVLLGLGGLILGFLIGGLLDGALRSASADISLRSQIPGLPMPDVVVSLVTFFILWIFSSFLK